MSETRCLRCREPLTFCACVNVSPLDLRTHVAVVLHTKAAQKRAAPSPFALTALTNSSIHLYGKRGAPLDLSELHTDGRRVFVLSPSEDAELLTPEFVQSSTLPVTLVVPDGDLRQVNRASRRIPGLASATRIRLSEPEHNMFVALARALGVLESPEIEAELLRLFANSQERRHLTFSHRKQAKEANGAAATDDELEKPKLDILYEDAHLIAVNKPSGMLVHRGWGKQGAVALQMLRDQVGQHVFPVHRLDRATSGALLFARSSGVARELVALFGSGDIEKRYLALCRGHELTETTIEHELAAEKGQKPVPAVTLVKLLGTFERYGLVEARPLTGRTHQIRKHLKHISHPIIGDVRYGKGEHNRLFRERFGFRRLALHCTHLIFRHPRTGMALSVHAPLPPDFSRLLRQLDLEQTYDGV